MGPYINYFDIDPEYLPQINKSIIEDKPDLWKKFYPHETFVKLLKDTISVLSRKQKMSIWVEGSYGTGKSHAVLTLKKLLDANEADTKDYFEKFSDQLTYDLYKQFQQVKTDDKKVLTVHRYGSSSIQNDNDLVFAIQDSILNALQENGMEYTGGKSLKNAAIARLSDENWKEAFNKCIQNEYSNLFFGDDVDGIIEKLKTYDDTSLAMLMKKIMQVGDEQGIKVLTMSTTDLCEWIKDIIEKNNLKGIVFIWDEFTEYFKLNMRALTGFQELADLSGSVPFYFIIVTHDVSHMFPETDKTWKHLQGRFIVPKCTIELPENMAFHLMGTAMRKNPDPVALKRWNELVDDLYNRTGNCRAAIKKKANISDDELKAILPIHPYAALILKHISSAFASNQRSMFDFIKNDTGDDIKGFQWFINNKEPYDDNPFLTVDMLWDYFYEKGKEDLSPDIRSILDCYSKATTEQLDDNEKRVFKVILLLQAISHQVGDAVELFIPNEENLDNAFEGSDLDVAEANGIAKKLVRDKVVYKQPLGGNKFQYCVYRNVVDTEAIDKYKKDIRNEKTSKLIDEGKLGDLLNLTGALRLRCKFEYVCDSNIKNEALKLQQMQDSDSNKLYGVMAFAKNDAEGRIVSDYIKELLDKSSDKFILIDASINPMGEDLYEQYVEAVANEKYQRTKNPNQANQHAENAKEILAKWKDKLEVGNFIVYSAKNKEGKRVTGIKQLINLLTQINITAYPLCLESGAPVTDPMWSSNALAKGAEYGAKQKVAGQFNDRLIDFIGKEAWKVDKYWESAPGLIISKIKIEVDKTINEGFEKEGRVSIKTIYDSLTEEPFGFLPCNLSAFVLGFVLKEYADGNYSWSDGFVNVPLDIAKLKDMIADIIKFSNTSSNRYKDNYIVKMTEDEKAFNHVASIVFNIDESNCTSIEDTRKLVRNRMQELSFPLWSIKEVARTKESSLMFDKLNDMVDCFIGLANNKNMNEDISDVTLASTIGKLYMDDTSIASTLAKYVNEDSCKEGMEIYLYSYNDGQLKNLAKEIDDKGQYINEVRNKFDADAATWVWNKDTAHKKIDEVILEYQIIAESNKYIVQSKNFKDCIAEWCNTCDNIRISYKYAEDEWQELSQLMLLLFDIKRQGTIAETKKNLFLDNLKIYGKKFSDFYSEQTPLFKRVCSYLFTQAHYSFTDKEITDIYALIPRSVFASETKAGYQSLVQEKIKQYLSDSKLKVLKDIWMDKTNTSSPKSWSEKYFVPIMIMVPENEFESAKRAFATLNDKHPSTGEVEFALEYISKCTYLEQLSDYQLREKLFAEKMIKSFSVILPDNEKVKEYLRTSLSDISPYDWFANPAVENKIKAMANAEYNSAGCGIALEKIDSMDEEDLKRYLKRLIQDNMLVGIEIIKYN